MPTRIGLTTFACIERHGEWGRCTSSTSKVEWVNCGQGVSFDSWPLKYVTKACSS